MKKSALFFLGIMSLALPAAAGPPYFTDDPVPTDTGHFEVYLFGAGTHTRAGSDGAAGLDVSYGGAKNLQLSATVPVAYETPRGAPTIGGIGNIELAAKYRFLSQEEFGLDVAVFPRVFLPSASNRVGDQHVSFFLPIWIGKDWDKWSTFGGGGCVITQGAGSKDFCLTGWAITRQVLPRLQVGAEIYHITAAAQGEHTTTGLGFGARYDVSEALHLVASFGPGLQHAATTNQYSWYTALLFTF
jgi:hypothetical protein